MTTEWTVQALVTVEAELATLRNVLDFHPVTLRAAGSETLVTVLCGANEDSARQLGLELDELMCVTAVEVVPPGAETSAPRTIRVPRVLDALIKAPFTLERPLTDQEIRMAEMAVRAAVRWFYDNLPVEDRDALTYAATKSPERARLGGYEAAIRYLLDFCADEPLESTFDGIVLTFREEDT